MTVPNTNCKKFPAILFSRAVGALSRNISVVEGKGEGG